MARRVIAAVLVVALASACTAPRGVWLDTGQGEPREYRLPSAHEPVKVGAKAFQEALEQWVLYVPLPVRSAREGMLVRAAYPGTEVEASWQRLMSKSFGGLCEEGELREECLSVLDDVMRLSEGDKLGVALGLSLEPLRESISEAVEDTLAPQLFFTVIATGLVTWVVLAANPEPVFTKAAALVSALMLLYLGVESFLEVVEASRELKRATGRATRPEELERAGQRFARRIGPEVARVFVLAVTVAVSQGLSGGAAGLASRLRMLPQLPEAAAVGAAGTGVTLANVGQVSAVAVAGSTVTLTLPSTAVAMAAQGQGAGAAPVQASGQLHHPISKRIARALARHDTLRGHYTERDPRFVTRAADKDSHNGYQKWHRHLDDEVIEWLDTYRSATPEEFEAFLRKLYSRPDLRARFPHGF